MLYLITISAALILAVYGMLLTSPYKKKQKKYIPKNYDELSKPFESNLYNDIYDISFKSPFVSFIPETENDKRAIELNKMIAKAGYSSKMDYRVIITLQTMLLGLAIIATIVTGFVLANALPFWTQLFNLQEEDVSPMTVFVILGSIFLLCALLPKLIISSKANNAETGFIKDLPILLIFVISMMESNRPIGEIIYTLGMADTKYKSIFANAYRIYRRDKEASFDYLFTAFDKTGFKDVIQILATSSEYSKEESLKVLSNKLPVIQEEVTNLKSKKNVIKSMVSEGSIALPFIAIALLGVVPIIMYFMNMISDAQSLVG